MKKKGILGIALLFLLLELFYGAFQYLDNECSFLGRSLLTDNNILASYGIKPDLYTRCHSSFSITDSTGGSIYFSFIPNPYCLDPPVIDKAIAYYLISDSHLYICEQDNAGDPFFKELRRDIQLEEVDIDKDQIIIDKSSKLVKIDVSHCRDLIAARDSCLHSIIIIICLISYILISSICFLVKKKILYKKQNS